MLAPILESLPPEARNHIVEFLPPRDALVVSRVSSLWLGHVRYCSAVWAGTLQRRFPISFGRIQAELADAKALRGGYLAYGEGVDYVQALSRLSRERYGKIDSQINQLLGVHQNDVQTHPENKPLALTTSISYRSEIVHLMKRWYNSSIISKATSVLSALIAWLKPLRIEHVIVLGLDNAGKSTALYFLQKGAIASVSPTMRGGPHKTYLYGRMQLTTWDASNSLSMFRRWLASFSSVSGLIFFLDAADTARMDEGLIALCQHLKEPQLADLPVLVLANKLDNNRALTTEQVADKVKTILAMERQWCVQGASIILRKGLDEGMQWLDKAIEEASNKRS